VARFFAFTTGKRGKWVVLVPAITLDVGRRMWYPSALAHRTGVRSAPSDADDRLAGGS
jgi:hypothetical protein